MAGRRFAHPPTPRSATVDLLPGVQGVEGDLDHRVQDGLVDVGSCLAFGAAQFDRVGGVLFGVGGAKGDLLPLCFQHAVIGGRLRGHLGDHGSQVDGDYQALQEPYLRSDARGGVLEFAQGSPACNQPVIFARIGPSPFT